MVRCGGPAPGHRRGVTLTDSPVMYQTPSCRYGHLTKMLVTLRPWYWGDCTYFSEFIRANMKLYELRNGVKLSTFAAANFMRNELAASLRKGPYQAGGCAGPRGPGRSRSKSVGGAPRRHTCTGAPCSNSIRATTLHGSGRKSPEKHLPTWAPCTGPHGHLPTNEPRLVPCLTVTDQSKSSVSYRASSSLTNQRARRVQGPFSRVNMLLAGYDADVDECSLFFIDYMASMQKVNSGGHGYGGMFCLSLFDKHWKPNMTRAEAGRHGPSTPPPHHTYFEPTVLYLNRVSAFLSTLNFCAVIG